MDYLYIGAQLFASVSVLLAFVFVASMLLGGEKGKERATMITMMLSAAVAFGFIWGWL